MQLRAQKSKIAENGTVTHYPADDGEGLEMCIRDRYVHRNTLVYRLERIEKAIGLDIRTFDDAMTFRIAVMVIACLLYTSRCV